jgi:hypothetical protein
MNVNERRAIRGVIKRLTADKAGCTPEVREALQNPELRIYLDTWVLPALELLVKQDRTRQDLELAADLAN